MTEELQIEIAAEFAIDPGQDILVERGGNASGIVVGVEEHLPIFDQVRAEQQRIAGKKLAADIAQNA